MDELKFFACAMFVVLMIMFVGVSAVVPIIERVNLVGDRAMIEQLRDDVRGVNIAEREDVMGQVTAVNQMIASNQEYNKNWFLGWYIPDGWDDIEKIPVNKSSLKLPSVDSPK